MKETFHGNDYLKIEKVSFIKTALISGFFVWSEVFLLIHIINKNRDVK